MNAGRIIVNIIVVFFLLIVLSFIGAVTFPGLPSTGSTLATYISQFLLLLVPVIILSIIGFFLGKGIRSLKNSLEALGLTYIGALIIGGILGLLTLLNFPYSAHINFAWLGGAWYAPWLALFLIGAPILLTFMV